LEWWEKIKNWSTETNICTTVIYKVESVCLSVLCVYWLLIVINSALLQSALTYDTYSESA